MREETIIEKNVSLPMVRRLAMEAGFSRMRVVPLRSSAGYVFDYAATPDDALPLRQMWDDTLRHAMRPARSCGKTWAAPRCRGTSLPEKKFRSR